MLFCAFSPSLSARTAVAQPAVYITGSAFADIKRFGTTTGMTYLGDEDFSLDGTGAGGGLRIATFLHPRVSVELAVIRQNLIANQPVDFAIERAAGYCMLTACAVLLRAIGLTCRGHRAVAIEISRRRADLQVRDPSLTPA